MIRPQNLSLLLLLLLLNPSSSRFPRSLLKYAYNAPVRAPPTKPPHVSPTPTNLPRSVLIVGGGSAGVGAAARLVILYNITDVTILEGADHLGGRLLSKRLPSSITEEFPALQDIYLEQGGNWIHGLSTNGTINAAHPLYSLALAANISTSHNNLILSNYDDLMAFTENGTVVTSEFNERFTLFSSAMRSAWELNLTSDISIKAGLTRFGWTPQTALDRAIEWSDIDFEYAEKPRGCSLKYGMVDTYERARGVGWGGANSRPDSLILHAGTWTSAWRTTSWRTLVVTGSFSSSFSRPSLRSPRST